MKTNPNHKASFSVGVAASCSCGWRGVTWFNTGAKRNAAGEWRAHREKCEAVERAAKAEIERVTGSATTDAVGWVFKLPITKEQH